MSQQSELVIVNTAITNLIYEDIPCNSSSEYTFARAKYGDFDVVMMKENGYINATNLCENGKKELKNWLRNDLTNDLINFFTELEYEPCKITIRANRHD